MALNQSSPGITSFLAQSTTNSRAAIIGSNTANDEPAVVGLTYGAGGAAWGLAGYYFSGATKRSQVLSGGSVGAFIADWIPVGFPTAQVVAQISFDAAAGGFYKYNGGAGSTTRAIELANASYSLFNGAGQGPGKIPDGVTTFTGQHEGVTTETPEPGDIVVDFEIVNHIDINNAISSNGISTSSNQTSVIGVCSKVYTDFIPNGWSYSPTTSTEYLIPPGHNVMIINSLGEGLINVCGENGNIEKGDLIVTSNIPGKGMKQNDDIIRSYTVAKARESVTFTGNEIKQIACIYVCG